LRDIAAKLDQCGLFKSEIIAPNVEQKHARQNQYLYMSHKIAAVARALLGLAMSRAAPNAAARTGNQNVTNWVPSRAAAG